MRAEGHVFKYGDNVDTDVIIPARYLNATKGEELAAHCMEDIDKEFIQKVSKGDIIVANKNFGCGSSREHAPLAIKCAGVSCVIAETFARIFYRNAINIGLPIIECPEAAKAIQAGDTVEVDFDSGVITDKTTGQSFTGQAFPPFMQKIITAGGLVNYINGRGPAGPFALWADSVSVKIIYKEMPSWERICGPGGSFFVYIRFRQQDLARIATRQK